MAAREGELGTAADSPHIAPYMQQLPGIASASASASIASGALLLRRVVVAILANRTQPCALTRRSIDRGV